MPVMPQPPAYTPATDFAEEESLNAGGRSTVNTSDLDAEFAAVAASIAAIRTNLALNQRDDGEIRDQRVKLHTLASDVLLLLTTYGSTPRGAWVTATAYAVKDLVAQGGNTYICVSAHTSGVFATDLAAVKWLLLALGAAPGASAIPFTPSATIAATDVQAAIEEADTENRALSASLVAALAARIANGGLATDGSGMVAHDSDNEIEGAVVGAMFHCRSVMEHGASRSNSNAQNKLALQAAITAAGAAGGGTVVVPSWINYGYDVDTRSTWPDFSGIPSPVIVIDYSPGNSYAGFPTAYDGAQERRWMFTPQTTSPNQHDGDIFELRSSKQPNFVVMNDRDLTGARIASDNRRARFTIMNDGRATWSIGQGSLESATATSEELSNFIEEKYSAPGDTLGAYFLRIAERKTGRIAYGLGTNTPAAAHHFAPCNTAESLPVMLVQSHGAVADVQVQSTSGASARTYLRNSAGSGRIGVTTGGDALRIRQADAYVGVGTAADPTFRLAVEDTRASNYASQISNLSATNGFVCKWVSTSVQANTWSFLDGYANAGADRRVTIAGTGDITNVNNSYGAISDLKLKQDVVDAGSAWTDFKGIQVRKYRFKSDPTGPLQLGVVAQELETVSPGLVEDVPDLVPVEKQRLVPRQRLSAILDGNGRPIVQDYEDVEHFVELVPSGTVTKQVKYSVLYMKACRVVQEAQHRIEALEARLAALEKKA
jgi:hypothetical protein